MWIVKEGRGAAKALRDLPKQVGRLYDQLVDDLEHEGTWPLGWDVARLQGSERLRIKLTREYRVIIEIQAPDIIVVKIAHRKEVYR